jgi:proline dehydrogenase
LAKEGYVVKTLIAYGDAWYAWYLRRLAERPANVMFIARQLLP